MNTWPAQLPRPLLAGASLEQTSAFVRSEMDVGPARQRRRTSAAPLTQQASVMFNTAQFRLFQAWYRYRIDDGAAWFEAPFVDNGFGPELVEVRFTEGWRSEPQGRGLYRVSMTLEVRAVPSLTPEQLDELLPPEL